MCSSKLCRKHFIWSPFVMTVSAISSKPESKEASVRQHSVHFDWCTHFFFCFVHFISLIGGSDSRLIYRHYATLYFVFCVDSSESELGILDLIQVFVETLDKCFENVCELDLIFHVDKVKKAIFARLDVTSYASICPLLFAMLNRNRCITFWTNWSWVEWSWKPTWTRFSRESKSKANWKNKR